MVKFYINWLLLLSCIIGFGNLAHARPKLTGVKANQLQPGSQAVLTLLGSGFKEIKTVDAIRIGGFRAAIMEQSITSDTTIFLKIRVPISLKPGKHRISVVVTGLTFTERFESQIGGEREKELELQINGNTIPENRESPINFGSVTKDTSVTREFLIKNPGRTPLILSPPELPPGFYLEGVFPERIPPGSGALFQIKFQGDTSGVYTGDITFQYTTTGTKTFRFPVSGKVEPPPVPNIELIAGSHILTFGDTTTLDFDNLPGDSAIGKTIYLKNNGKEILYLTPPVIPAGFRLAGPFPASLKPGEQVPFRVEFTGNTANPYQGQIQFTITNYPDYPFTFQVKKSSTAPPASQPLSGDTTLAAVSPSTPSPGSDSLAEPPPTLPSEDNDQVPGWLIVGVLVISTLIIVLSGRYFFRRAKAASVQTAGSGAGLEPTFYFKTQQDWGSRDIGFEGSGMVQFTLRLKPILDWGESEIAFDEDSLVDKQEFERHKTSSRHEDGD